MARLAIALQQPFSEETAWRTFTTSPLLARDRPGLLDRIFIPRRVPVFPRPSGDLFRLERYPFFSTTPLYPSRRSRFATDR